ncbi:cytochrome P450 family protein [Delphinella strobiligena]|nr:cytochrome P450 family protein [Delphinella strobiligena]
MPAYDITRIPLADRGQNAALLSILLFGILVVYVTYQRFFHHLASVSGPFCWASLTRLWVTKHSWDGDMHRTMIDLHEKHGALVRTGPNEVSVSDLNSIKTIYGAGTKFRKSDWYSLHGKQRSLISSAYSMTSLKDLEPHVDECVHKFLDIMDGMQGQVIDMGKWVQLFAFDIIGEISFSRSFGFMDSAKDDGSFKQIEDALQSAAWVGQMPWVFWLNYYLTPIFGNKLSISNRHGSIRALALFAAQQAKAGELDDTAVASMATSNIFAGSDTTAISTPAIIYYLLKNPQYKQRLVEEIDNMRKQGKLSDPVTLQEAESMPYLQAVMYEALRCHPAVGMSLPRVVPPGGVVIDGTHLPANTVIGANPWVIHRNNDVYGEDVEEFRPDRWLKGDPADMRRFFFAFGSGARMCLGRNISWLEMSKLVPALFYHYNIELADSDAVWSESCYWFVMQQGLHVRVTKRAV